MEVLLEDLEQTVQAAGHQHPHSTSQPQHSSHVDFLFTPQGRELLCQYRSAVDLALREVLRMDAILTRGAGPGTGSPEYGARASGQAGQGAGDTAGVGATALGPQEPPPWAARFSARLRGYLGQLLAAQKHIARALDITALGMTALDMTVPSAPGNDSATDLPAAAELGPPSLLDPHPHPHPQHVVAGSAANNSSGGGNMPSSSKPQTQTQTQTLSLPPRPSSVLPRSMFVPAPGPATTPQPACSASILSLLGGGDRSPWGLEDYPQGQGQGSPWGLQDYLQGHGEGSPSASGSYGPPPASPHSPLNYYSSIAGGALAAAARDSSPQHATMHMGSSPPHSRLQPGAGSAPASPTPLPQPWPAPAPFMTFSPLQQALLARFSSPAPAPAPGPVPSGPGYAAPGGPGYAAPGGPGYAAPGGPGYAAPDGPGYAEPPPHTHQHHQHPPPSLSNWQPQSASASGLASQQWQPSPRDGANSNGMQVAMAAGSPGELPSTTTLVQHVEGPDPTYVHPGGRGAQAVAAAYQDPPSQWPSDSDQLQQPTQAYDGSRSSGGGGGGSHEDGSHLSPHPLTRHPPAPAAAKPREGEGKSKQVHIQVGMAGRVWGPFM